MEFLFGATVHKKYRHGGMLQLRRFLRRALEGVRYPIVFAVAAITPSGRYSLETPYFMYALNSVLGVYRIQGVFLLI